MDVSDVINDRPGNDFFKQLERNHQMVKISGKFSWMKTEIKEIKTDKGQSNYRRK